MDNKNQKDSDQVNLKSSIKSSTKNDTQNERPASRPRSAAKSDKVGNAGASFDAKDNQKAKEPSLMRANRTDSNSYSNRDSNRNSNRNSNRDSNQRSTDLRGTSYRDRPSNYGNSRVDNSRMDNSRVDNSRMDNSRVDNSIDEQREHQREYKREYKRDSQTNDQTNDQMNDQMNDQIDSQRDSQKNGKRGGYRSDERADYRRLDSQNSDKDSNRDNTKDNTRENNRIDSRRESYRERPIRNRVYNQGESSDHQADVILYDNDKESGNDCIRLMMLSGAEEIGMNMAIYSYDDGVKKTNIIVDCGISFANLPGADVIMPDLPSILDQGLKIDAIVLTHGHEDHIGALPYMLNYLAGVPIYATYFTCGLIDRKLRYDNPLKNKNLIKGKKNDYPIHKIKLGETRHIGSFTIKWIAVTHSIPDSTMLAIEAGGVRVLHTGDWKIDPKPIIGPTIDSNSLESFGKKGVHALISDSTNIHQEESANSEGDVGDSLRRLAKQTSKGKFVLTCFSSNVARIKSCIDAAKECGRRVVIIGGSLQKSFEIATDLGYLQESIMTEEEASQVAPEELFVICTGSQGEENSALWKIANRMRTAGTSLERGDTIVFSARVIDGRQGEVRKIINQLVERGVRVLHPWNSKNSCIHASGHPARPDIKQLWKMVNPRCVIPVHAEAEHRFSHLAFAKENGFQTHNIKNGYVIEIRKDSVTNVQSFKVGKLAYDGSRLLPLQSNVFKERGDINKSGVVAVSIGYKNKQQFVLVSSYGVFDRGIDVDESNHSFLKNVKNAVESSCRKYSFLDFRNQAGIKQEISKIVRDCVYRSIKKNPSVFCHIVI